MTRPWINVRDVPFVPGRALVHRGALTCICGSTTAHLSQSGHLIRCAGCRSTEMAIHTGHGEATDLMVAGYDYAEPAGEATHGE